VTFISASIDIGFGNHLYLRGEGPGPDLGPRHRHGLHRRRPLDRQRQERQAAPVIFKVLVNDISWSTGDDFVVAPGQSITVTPSF
jgi:hypothetical protein